MKRKGELCQSIEKDNNNKSNKAVNIFTDQTASHLFEQIRDIAIKVMN